uniref:Uncharacterized protein n=1 Tax=Anguilla anguilla TaxID=7936 RepID=A0A0E9TD17_ANGAN
MLEYLLIIYVVTVEQLHFCHEEPFIERDNQYLKCTV